MQECAICIRNLRKSFKQTDVLKGVDLDLQKGQIFCLLGSNGAGKTTLVKILATLIEADSGEVMIYGYDIKRYAEQIREMISLTGQFAAVDGLLTVRENLLMIGRLSHIQDASSKCDLLLEQFSLQHVADRLASTLSGGTRRRLDIAMGLIGNPEIVFLDEPTTGLDPQSRIEMWKVIRAMAGKGVTVFLTTQYIEEAEQLADHIAILHQGTIIKQGRVQDLKSILSRSAVILRFEELASYLAAQEMLDGYVFDADSEAMSISVTTDGSVKQLSDILSRLSDVKIGFLEQKQASLEDVFLALVS